MVGQVFNLLGWLLKYGWIPISDSIKLNYMVMRKNNLSILRYFIMAN